MSLPTVTPAYGRDYKSLKSAQADWDAGKDFYLTDMFHGSGYTSARDWPNGAMVRYSKLTKIGKLKPAPAPKPVPATAPAPMTFGAVLASK
jgi:hypothetical protein